MHFSLNILCSALSLVKINCCFQAARTSHVSLQHVPYKTSICVHGSFNLLPWHNLLLLVNSQIGFGSLETPSRSGETGESGTSVQSFRSASTVSNLYPWYFSEEQENLYLKFLFSALGVGLVIMLIFLFAQSVGCAALFFYFFLYVFFLTNIYCLILFYCSSFFILYCLHAVLPLWTYFAIYVSVLFQSNIVSQSKGFCCFHSPSPSYLRKKKSSSRLCLKK